MKGIVKFIVGIGVGAIVLNLLPDWISSPWLRVPIFVSCVGIICLWDEFKDDFGNVGGVLVAALAGVLLLGFWVLNAIFFCFVRISLKQERDSTRKVANGMCLQ